MIHEHTEPMKALSLAKRLEKAEGKPFPGKGLGGARRVDDEVVVEARVIAVAELIPVETRAVLVVEDKVEEVLFVVVVNVVAPVVGVA